MTDTNVEGPDHPSRQEILESLTRLSRDLAKAAITLTDREVRFIVDNYYITQESRKRADNQVLAMRKSQEPHDLITWVSVQSDIIEQSLKRALDQYTSSKPIGVWLKSIYGIGPVISAGLMAHIDIKLCPTVGHIWRFAGLDPSVSWKRGEIRPWNAGLKTLSWKVGQSFMRFSNQEACTYGHVYRSRKDIEVKRNESGRNAETAKQILETRNITKQETRAFLLAGQLPPGQVDGRARRFVVKLFLSHLHLVWTF